MGEKLELLGVQAQNTFLRGPSHLIITEAKFELFSLNTFKGILLLCMKLLVKTILNYSVESLRLANLSETRS